MTENGLCKDCPEWLTMYVALLEEHFRVTNLVQLEQATRERLENIQSYIREGRP